jgi:hypothetical protein
VCSCSWDEQDMYTADTAWPLLVSLALLSAVFTAAAARPSHASMQAQPEWVSHMPRQQHTQTITPHDTGMMLFNYCACLPCCLKPAGAM